MDKVELHDVDILVDGPLGLVDVWVQVVVPAFTALLPDAAWEALGHLGPVAWSVLTDKFHKDSVFFFCPSASDTVIYVVQLEPTDVALNLGLARHQLTNSIPGVAAELVYPHLKFFIL